MKAITIETGQFAAAVLPRGGVTWAPCMGALRLKLATTGIEPEKWRPKGKAGLKAAVLAALGSDDVPTSMYAFCDAYMKAGKPEGAYACWIEIALVGAKKFGAGADFSMDSPIEYGGAARANVARALAKILVGSTGWKKSRNGIGRVLKGRKPENLIKAFVDGENASWDEKDAEDALRVALANPRLVELQGA